MPKEIYRRKRFFARYVIAVFLTALAFVYVSYDVVATWQWLFAFDPLAIEFRSPYGVTPPISLDTSIGMWIEVGRTFLLCVTVYALRGVLLDIEAIDDARRKLQKVGLINRPSRLVPEVPGKSDHLDKWCAYLWGRNWKWMVLGIALALAVYHFAVGPLSLERSMRAAPTDEASSNEPTLADLKTRIEKSSDISPSRVLIPEEIFASAEKLAANGAMASEEALLKGANAHRKWLAAVDKNGDVRDGVRTYFWYFPYSLMNYLFLVGPLLAAYWSIFSRAQHDVEIASAALRRKSSGLSIREVKSLLQDEGFVLKDLALAVLRPIGWLAIFVFVNGLYEHFIGRLTLGALAGPIVLFTFLLVPVLLLHPMAMLNAIDGYAQGVASVVGTSDSKFLGKLDEISPENILKDGSVMWVWRLLERLRRPAFRFLTRLSRSPS